MPGRADFSQPGTAGSGQTVAVNSRPEISTEISDQDATIPAGESETIEFYPPTGSTYKVIDMFFQAPAISGTSGVHRVRVASVGILYSIIGESNYGDKLRINQSRWDATAKQQPSNEAALSSQIQSLRGTENSPISINYKNETDADQTSKRLYRLAVEEVSY